MCAFQCDSCFHKKVCMECPDTGGVNVVCALYANVKNFTDMQQLKAEIRAICDVVADDKQNGGGCVVNLKWLLKALRELSAI